MPIYTGDMKVNDTNVSVTPDALAPAENGLECNLQLPPECWSADDGFNSADVTINGDINFYIEYSAPVYLLPPEFMPVPVPNVAEII